MHHDGVAVKLIGLGNLIRRALLALEEDESAFQLTSMQRWVMGYLHHQPETQDVFQKDIEQVFQLRGSTVTGMLKIMERNGYIVRQSVSYDARRKKLLLTEKAKRFCGHCDDRIEQMEKKLLKGITQGEKQELERLLQLVANNLLNQEEEIQKHH